MIRHAEIQDLTAIEAVYAHARKFMEETGNPNQWGKNHPPRATLENAIAARKLYVLEEDGAIHGSFYFASRRSQIIGRLMTAPGCPMCPTA